MRNVAVDAMYSDFPTKARELGDIAAHAMGP
jgi:hypothetical protein